MKRLLLCVCSAIACAYFGFAPDLVWSTAERPAHRVQIAGRGEPTVIFESGLGDTLDAWRGVQPSIASSCARTLTYSRAGYPGSSPATGARDARTVVSELRGELRQRGIFPPYVLVGHSLGGLYMQYFARQYPKEVAGLVLIDSTHWNQRLLMGSPMKDKHREVMVFMSFIAQRELADSALAGEQVHTSPPAVRVPTIVLSSTGVLLGETPTARALAARLQEDIAADFPGARHIRVDRSGHYIQRDRPDVVIRSVRELIHCHVS
ncbi:MAG TPA: alpha/beta hydrolase [Steroidobacter sp.]|jgi:pimeloyl-ACP methyl ester carboxylesterase|nr:alpha/beta hydrolase [Steroidobacter sp.]